MRLDDEVWKELCKRRQTSKSWNLLLRQLLYGNASVRKVPRK